MDAAPIGRRLGTVSGAAIWCLAGIPLPVSWSAENVAWKTELPGPGALSPVTYGDRIYLTCYSGYGVDRESPGDPSEFGAASALHRFEQWSGGVAG